MVWGGTAILGGDPLQTNFHGEDPTKNGIRLGAGLGLVDRLVVDTHFGERGRLPRVAYTLAKSGGGLGIGSDPLTGAVVRMDGRIEAIGRGTITVVRVSRGADVKTNGPLAVKGLKVDILAGGDVLQVEPLAAPQAP
jgi:cyanophycinase